MRCRIYIIMLIMFFASMAFAKEIDPNKHPCFYHGVGVMINWYQLDLCLKYKVMSPDVVKQARDIIFKSYPKIQYEIKSNSKLARWAQDRATNFFPYDFSKKENAQLLAGICKSDVFFLHLVTKNVKWTNVLTCWR